MRQEITCWIASLLILGVCHGARGEHLPESPAGTAASNVTPAELGIKPGDTFVFLGDSITYDCGWTELVENYFYSRFPHSKIRFVNAAVGGDRSWTVEERFDKSIAPLKPKFATIMVGMNDGRYRAFDPELYTRYQASMTAVLDRLESMGTTVVTMSPGHFDRQSSEKMRAQPFINYNGVLSFFGNWLREESWRRKLQFVDVNPAMSRVLVAQRQTDPKFTLTNDGIHTNPMGNFVMAVTLLEGLGLPSQVSAIQLTRNNSDWSPQVEGGALSDLKADETTLNFTFQADSLPWVVLDEIRAGYNLTHASRRLNRETLRMSGLNPGQYELKIDGASVGKYSHAELGIGVELQDNQLTPQYQQSYQLAKLNRMRSNHMRSYAKSWFMWVLRGPERNAIAVMKPGQDRYDEFHGRAMQSEEALRAAPSFLEKADAMIPQVYEAAQPQAHVYELVRIDSTREVGKEK